MRDRRMIRAALAEPGATVSGVARALGVDRGTVRRARDSDHDWYRLATDEFEPAVRKLLERFPQAPSGALAAAVGWERSWPPFSRLVARLRTEYADRPAVPGVAVGPRSGG